MRISWAIEGHGAGMATAGSADHAARLLADVVRSTYPADAVGAVLYSAVGPLRAQMVTDGRYAVARGRSWEGRAGGILVTLSPD